MDLLQDDVVELRDQKPLDAPFFAKLTNDNPNYHLTSSAYRRSQSVRLSTASEGRKLHSQMKKIVELHSLTSGNLEVKITKYQEYSRFKRIAETTLPVTSLEIDFFDDKYDMPFNKKKME